MSNDERVRFEALLELEIKLRRAAGLGAAKLDIEPGERSRQGK